MALLGVLSILQIVFLPGYLLAQIFRFRGGFLATLVLAFALSLVANHVMVAGLVVLGIYRPAIVYAVFIAEAATFLWIHRGYLHISMIDACRFRFSDFTGEFQHSPLRRMFLAVAMIVLAGFALSGMAQIGQIFQQWDAVVSWNRWAIDWAANRLPSSTSLYPQLLPTNISLTYVFMQTSDIWIFAKAFQFLFCLMLLLAMFDAARATGNFGYVPGVFITYWLLVAVLRFRMISSGYADMPLAFFSFAAVYTLLLARHAEGVEMRQRYVIIGAVLAAGAAMTKQTGLYIALLYPLLAWLLVFRSHGLWRHAGSLLRVALLIGILVSPWYLYKFAEFHAARDHNNTPLLVADFHEGRNLPQRIHHAASMVVEAITPVGAMFLLLAIGVALCDPVHRWLVGLLVVPLGCIWAAAFSYDLRNLALILPFAGAAAGTGLLRAAEWIGPRAKTSWVSYCPYTASITGISPVFKGRVVHLVGLVALAVVAVCLCVSDTTLRECQVRQQRMVGIPELNGRLYAYFESHRGNTVIATDYQAMAFLPELGSRSVPCVCDALNAFRAIYDRPEVRYALIWHKGAATPVQEYFNGPACRLIFEARGYRFYEKPEDPTH